MKNTVLISGSGGQGIVSAGILLAQSAVEVGLHATFLPEYGPEQRGGSAKCTVILCDSAIVSPLPKQCMHLIAMNEQSFKKFGNQLKVGGNLFLNTNRVVSPVTREDVRIVSIPAEDIALEIGNIKTANIVMIGALLGATQLMEPKAYLASLAEKFADKNPDIMRQNTLAMERGYAIAAHNN